MDTKGLEGFFKFLAESREQQDRVRGMGSDAEALAAYAREKGFNVSADALRECQNKARELLNIRLQKKLAEPKAALSPGAKAFFDFMKMAEGNSEMEARLEELATGTPEQLIAYGKENGFTFDRQDMLDIGKEILEPTDELNDEELEMVAGGIVDLIALAVFVGIGLGVAVAGGVGVAAGVGAVAGFVLGFTALAKK